LELAAHRLPAPRQRAARSGLRGHVCLAREAACLFLGVPLCICQRTSTFT